MCVLESHRTAIAMNKPQKTVSLLMPILNTLPVRAKAKVNRLPILLPLQGVGVYTLIPRALPWAMNWLPFQGVPFRTLFVYPVRMLCHLSFDPKTAHPRPAHFRHHCNTISFPFFTQGWILTMTEIYSLSKSSSLSVSGGMAG